MDPDTTSQEEDEDEEFSPLEYARSQGICVDYTTEPLCIFNFDQLSKNDIDRDLCGPTNASITNATRALTKERLAVNRKGVLFLKAVHSLREELSVDLSMAKGIHRALGLKQELPVLDSDYELDLLRFGKATNPDFRNLQIPSEIVIDQNDEAFEWPSKYLMYPALYDAQLKAEKLAVSRSVLVHLQEAIRDACVPEDSEVIKAEALKHEPNIAIRPVTPPLLPLSPLQTPYVPSSPANHLPLLPDSSDSVLAEAQYLEGHIMAADSLTRKNSDSSDSMLLDITHPPPFSPLSEIDKLTPAKRRADDLKVEGPLTPPMFSTSPMKKLKSVSFAAMLDEYIPYQPWGQDNTDEDDEVTSLDFEFFRYIEPLAERARIKVENEQLSGPDTTARVDVPNMDFSLPVAPWIEYSNRKRGKYATGGTELQAQTQFLSRVKREDLKFASSWHGLSVPERELQWGFLTTKIFTLNLEEKLHGGSEVEKTLIQMRPGSIATSFSQIWKRDGLRILDEDDEEEEELESMQHEDKRDMESLIRKRKLEMEETTGRQIKRSISQQPFRTEGQPSAIMHYRGASPGHHNAYDQRSREQTTSQKPITKDKQKGDGLMFDGFSAATALQKFMETRGKPAESSRPHAAEVPVSRNHPQPLAKDLPARLAGPSYGQARKKLSEHQNNELDKSVSEGGKISTPEPLPALPALLESCSFIVSSAFLQQRCLLKQIEKLFPKAEMMYRDYNLPHSAAKEADIILSPSTGLIFTTLQQVKQRALPGQADRSPIKERVFALQSRYERLVIVVSEGLSREMENLGSSRPHDPRDIEAVEVFTAFASGMEGEVLVRYVVGGEKALALSTVVEMARYGLPYGSPDIGDIKPVAQETTYEAFLRRAGLNPFAAQAIVALLKKPMNFEVPLPPSSPLIAEPKIVTVNGLPRFLIMSADERIRSFQALMGGSRILKGVSRLLDREWISAAHGFRV